MRNFKLSLIAAFIVVLGCPSAGRAQSAKPNFSCKTGPIDRTYGGTSWQVYSCDDALSLAFVASKDSPASPSYFMITPQDGHYHLVGKATGDLDIANAASKDMQSLSKSDVDALIAATKTGK